MADDRILLPFLWRRSLSGLRSLVGAACLWRILAEDGLHTAALTALACLLVVHGVAVHFWRWLERADRLNLLSLTLDLATFLLCVSMRGPGSFWLAAFAALVLFLSAATIEDYREVLLVTILSLAFIGGLPLLPDTRLPPLLVALGLFGAVTAIQRAALSRRLARCQQQVVALRAEREASRREERERMAADLHDGPLQAFTGFQMRLEALRRSLDRNPDSVAAELASLQETAARQAGELRAFVRLMRPPETEGIGLASALRSLVTVFQNDTGIAAAFHDETGAAGDDIVPPIELLQLVGEALHNVQKHSRASRVDVVLRVEPPHVTLTIRDDGAGFPFAGTHSLDELEKLRRGPVSIRRRARELNADLTLHSLPGHGSTIEVRLPLA